MKLHEKALAKYMNVRTFNLTKIPTKLTIIGDIGVDIVMGPLKSWPSIGTEILMERSEMRAGGSAGNAALAAQSLGTSVHLIAGVGSDSLGQWLISQFYELQADIETIPAATTTTVGLIHAGGDRNFFTTHGHLDAYDGISTLPPAEPGAVALLTGVFLMPRLRKRYVDLISRIRRQGYAVAIDTGWPSEGWTPSVIEEVRSWLALSDHVLLNDLEICSLAARGDLKASMEHIIGWLRPGATLVAKVGRDGAIGCRGEARFSATPPMTSPIFDTIGAGDAFNAGYLDALIRGQDIFGALTAGCVCATKTIGHFPRQRSLPEAFQEAR